MVDFLPGSGVTNNYDSLYLRGMTDFRKKVRTVMKALVTGNVIPASRAEVMETKSIYTTPK